MELLQFDGVRCFRDTQVVPIRPVTLLVGENSSGKSTVLALARAAWDLAFGRTEPDFNEEPFNLGSYDAIAHYHGGQAKRVTEFRIGTSFPASPGAGARRVWATFSDRAGQPALTGWFAEAGEASVSVRSADGKSAHVTARYSGKPVWIEDVAELPIRGTLLPVGAFLSMKSFHESVTDEAAIKQRGEFLALLPGFSLPLSQRPIASAPVRSKPERTYDPKRAIQEPEGSHVPMELAALQVTNPNEFVDLMERIGHYGRESNLFSRLDVRRKGKGHGDPFQLLVAVQKFPFNLRDVGYGVSQILPILVDTLLAPPQQTYLLQQPEVHLHPRAQAMLGSFLVDQAVHRKHKFVVETHSDYLVDRVRMAVREGKGQSGLKAADVIILYFERDDQGRAVIHPIQIDERGELQNVPAGYRAFFLSEERRLLGI